MSTTTEREKTYEPCGNHGYDFDDDCGWCWVLRPTTADQPTTEPSAEQVQSVALKIVRWGVDEARERDAMYEEALNLLDSAEDEAATTALAARIEAAIAALLAPAPQPAADTETGDEHHTMEELYEYRMLYNAHAARGWVREGFRVVKSWKHSDGEPCFGGGWFIVVALLPGQDPADGFRQVANHYSAEHWDLFDVPAADQSPIDYDGHTPADGVQRLRAALTGQEEG